MIYLERGDVRDVVSGEVAAALTVALLGPVLRLPGHQTPLLPGAGMVLSRRKPRKPPTNMLVSNRTLMIWSSSGTQVDSDVQVSLMSWFFFIHWGRTLNNSIEETWKITDNQEFTSEKNIENPRTNRFLVELRSTN